ncbi:hypothetical protein C8R47DRAFT_1320156 [Mycena vitilis]|nr:hypothetical protein C8R47DRAFT_1320156 [Mycena vitilis]
MDLVFHHAATVLGLDSKHRTLADSPSLKIISERCQHLLEHSTLRRERPKYIAPFHSAVQGISFASLRTFAKHETGLEMILSFLGAIKLRNHGPGFEDMMWVAEICSLFAQKQSFESKLYGLYAAIDNILEESNRDKEARSLFERDPHPLLTTWRRRLARKPIMDLYGMNEAVFQTMLDSLWEDDSNDAILDPSDKRREPGRYLHNYVPQLGLCTDPTRLRIPAAEGKGKGKEVTQPSNPSGPSTSKASKASSCDCSCHTDCGQAGPNTKGITTAEKRVDVKRVNNAADADEVLGYLICGIGRRIISIAVDPDVQNTGYQFSVSPGGIRSFEKTSAAYVNMNEYWTQP